MVTQIYKVTDTKRLAELEAYCNDPLKSWAHTADWEVLLNMRGDLLPWIRFDSERGIKDIRYVLAHRGPLEHLAEHLSGEVSFLRAGGKGKIREKGAIYQHIILSLPYDFQVPEMDLMTFGAEFLRWVAPCSTAVIYGHMHPVDDDEGDKDIGSSEAERTEAKGRGRCQHLHILLKAYIDYDKYNGSGPYKVPSRVIDYYEIVDEMCIKYGWPIIRDPEMKAKMKSGEYRLRENESSWKERMALDIDECKGKSTSWADFVKLMEKKSYTINEAGPIKYIDSDKHEITDRNLGASYTKEKIEFDWVDQRRRALLAPGEMSTTQTRIHKVYSIIREEKRRRLSVNIPIGSKVKQIQKYAPLELSHSIMVSEEALLTYFNPEELYAVRTEDGQIVLEMRGHEILLVCRKLRDQNQKRWERELRQREKGARYARIKKEEDTREMPYARYPRIPINEYYYDEDGRRRTWLEKAFFLALILMDKEAYLWLPREDIPEDRPNELFFAKTNWEIQKVIDGFALAKEMQVKTLEQLERKMEIYKLDCSRGEAECARLKNAIESMAPYENAAKYWDSTCEMIEALEKLPEESQKEERERKREELEKFAEAKALLEKRGATTLHKIRRIIVDADELRRDLKEAERRLEKDSQDYRKLIKLSKNLTWTEEYIMDRLRTPERNHREDADKDHLEEVDRSKEGLFNKRVNAALEKQRRQEEQQKIGERPKALDKKVPQR